MSLVPEIHLAHVCVISFLGFHCLLPDVYCFQLVRETLHFCLWFLILYDSGRKFHVLCDDFFLMDMLTNPLLFYIYSDNLN